MPLLPFSKRKKSSKTAASASATSKFLSNEPSSTNTMTTTPPTTPTYPIATTSSYRPSFSSLPSPIRKAFQTLFPPTIATRLYLLITIIESVADIALEAYFLSKLDLSAVLDVKDNWNRTEGGDWKNKDMSGVVPVYLALFVMAHIFQIVIALNALSNQNFIQILGLDCFNVLMCLYSILQIGEIRGYPGQFTNELVVVIPGIIGAAQIGFMILTWYLFKEFGWKVYKKIGGDRVMKRYYFWYQIFICELKFDYFFFMAFAIQLAFLVLEQNIEYYLTISAIPVTFLALTMGYWAVRKEWAYIMVIFLILCVSGGGYFGFKIFRIITRRDTDYKYVFKSTLTFAVLSLLFLTSTFITAIVCLRHFGRGLSAYIHPPKRSPIRPEFRESNASASVPLWSEPNNRHNSSSSHSHEPSSNEDPGSLPPYSSSSADGAITQADLKAGWVYGKGSKKESKKESKKWKREKDQNALLERRDSRMSID